MRRLESDKRKASLAAAAYQLAEEQSLDRITRRAVADKAGCSPALISVYFRQVADLKREVIRQAVSKCAWRLIAEAYLSNGPGSDLISQNLANQAFLSLSQ